MLDINQEFMYKTFGYRYIIGPQSPPAQLHSLGWQIQRNSSYYFDGLKRPEEAGNCIFQYTLSGSGLLEIDGHKHVLKEGEAFLIAIPGNHRYFLPDDKMEWEFIFITLNGTFAREEWAKLQEMYGNVIQLKKEDEVIKYLLDIYCSAANNGISDGFQTSSIAYDFLMKLNKSTSLPALDQLSGNNSMEHAILFMKNNFYRDISLDDIAMHVHISKYHFNHKFMKTVGITPWNYLTKIRIEHSIRLLVTTDYTLDKISLLVGYTSANYYNKVFHKYVGLSPGKLREKYRNVNEYTLNI